MKATLKKENGSVTMDKTFEFMCSQLRNGTYTVSIERKAEPRTVSQNALMWMWFQCMEAETGTLKQDIHDYYCQKFLARRAVIGGVEKWVTGGTSKLNTAQMTDFLNKVQADAASEFGIMLPLPSDRFYQEFLNEYRRFY
ncbi:MAG: hypothetical protein Q4D30_01205 [Bacteroidales bacterium]|nr:hypothetical protein [Bacteroidales bacterium]